MIALTDIHALTDFLRNHKRHVLRLKEAGQPEVLTINGRAELVVQDAKSYQALLDRIERAEAVTGIKRGLEDVERGRTKTAGEALHMVRPRPKRSRAR